MVYLLIFGMLLCFHLKHLLLKKLKEYDSKRWKELLKKVTQEKKSTLYGIEENDIVLIHKKIKEMYYSPEIQPGPNIEITENA